MNPVKSVSCKCENLGLGLVPCADLFICVQQAESQRGPSVQQPEDYSCARRGECSGLQGACARVRMCFVGARCDLVLVCAQELSDVLVGKLIKKRGAGAGDQEIIINRSGACMG